MMCPRCNRMISNSDTKFCPECGYCLVDAEKKHCPQCSEEITEEKTKFCPECGFCLADVGMADDYSTVAVQHGNSAVTYSSSGKALRVFGIVLGILGSLGAIGGSIPLFVTYDLSGEETQYLLLGLLILLGGLALSITLGAVIYSHGSDVSHRMYVDVNATPLDNQVCDDISYGICEQCGAESDCLAECHQGAMAGRLLCDVCANGTNDR